MNDPNSQLPPPKLDEDAYNEALADMFVKATESLRVAIREHHRGHSEHGRGDLEIMLMQYGALHVLREEMEKFLLMSAPALNLKEVRAQCLRIWEQYRANGAGKNIMELLEQGVMMGPAGEA